MGCLDQAIDAAAAAQTEERLRNVQGGWGKMYRAHAQSKRRFCSRFRRSKWEGAVPDAAIRDAVDAKVSP